MCLASIWAPSLFFFFSSRRRHTRCSRDWSSDVCSSDLFYATWREKKLRGLFMTAVGNSGNAASRVAEFISSKGAYAYGGYPDIDDLAQQQSGERDVKKREALLHRIQQLTIDRAMFAPIMDLRALMGVGPRMADHTINLVPMTVWPSYEDMRVKNQ